MAPTKKTSASRVGGVDTKVNPKNVVKTLDFFVTTHEIYTARVLKGKQEECVVLSKQWFDDEEGKWMGGDRLFFINKYAWVGLKEKVDEISWKFNEALNEEMYQKEEPEKFTELQDETKYYKEPKKDVRSAGRVVQVRGHPVVILSKFWLPKDGKKWLPTKMHYTMTSKVWDGFVDYVPKIDRKMTSVANSCMQLE